jgi:Fe-S cluster assembly protein SufB
MSRRDDLSSRETLHVCTCALLKAVRGSANAAGSMVALQSPVGGRPCRCAPWRTSNARSARASRVSCAAAADELVREDAVDQQKRDLQKMLDRPYKYGFHSIIESDTFPPGLNEDVVRAISVKKEEPQWMLDFRLRAYRKWLTMKEPDWSDNAYPPIDYQALSYYSEPKKKEQKQSLDEVDPELLRTFDKLGIPLNEQKRLSNVAVDAVFDSVSIATTFREELAKAGVIFCSISEAVKEYPELVKQYLGSVVRSVPGPVAPT